MKIYSLLKQILLKFRIVQVFREIILRCRDYNKNRELRKSFGKKNPDKIFYVIRNYTREAGLGSIHNYVCLNIQYAVERGYIPIIDMQNYPNAYLEKLKFHKENSWEYYFEQPYPYTLAEVYQSKNVILCGTALASCGYVGMKDMEQIRIFNNLIDKYMHLNKKTEKVIEEEIIRVTGQNRRVLGVVCRGTDYIKLKPKFHSIPYSAEETIMEIRKYIDDYDAVYLATEDSSILQKFREGISENKLIYTKAFRYDPEEVDSFLYKTADKRGDDKYIKGLDYLKIIYVLANCTSLMAPIIGSSVTATRINGGKYEKLVILEKGQY